MNTLEVLQHIATLQVKERSQYYPKGLFPSQRYHYILPYKREDSNIYFSAITAYTLKSLLPFLEKEEQIIAQKIINEVVQNYPNYRGKKDKSTFNFYQTHPLHHFPNGIFLSRFKHFAVAEDTDVTAMVVMSQKEPLNTQEKEHLQQLFNSFANLKRKKAVHSKPPYNELEAYGIWLGTGKMPVELDLCVITNILLLAKQYNWKEDEVMKASFDFIIKAIESNDYLYDSFSVSYIYPNPIVILYHITRLMVNYDYDNLNSLRRKLIKDAKKLINKDLSFIERILLSTSLLRLKKNPDLQINISNYDYKLNPLSLFCAPILSGTNSKLLNTFAKNSFFHIQYNCEAYNWVLLLENLILNEKANEQY